MVESGPALDPGAVPAEVTGSNFLATAALRDRNDTGLLARRVSTGEATLYRRGRGVGGSSVVNAMVALRGDPALYRSWGWDDVERAWDVVAVPEELPGDDELGPVDLALLAADDDAQRARLTRRGRHRVTSAEAYLWPALGRAESDHQIRCRGGACRDRRPSGGRRGVEQRRGDRCRTCDRECGCDPYAGVVVAIGAGHAGYRPRSAGSSLGATHPGAARRCVRRSRGPRHRRGASAGRRPVPADEPSRRGCTGLRPVARGADDTAGTQWVGPGRSRPP